MGKGHALLSPSAAHRWLHCTAAPRLESTVEDRGSTFAEEGTLAHAYCARKLKKFLGQDTTEEDREIRLLNGKYHTDEYAAFVLERLAEARRDCPDARLLVEVRLDLTEYIPEAFGTADAVIVADGRMEIIDFKYGRGVEVSAKDNPQMKIYALGALELFAGDYDITDVRMTIVQPRLNNISTYETTAEELVRWAKIEVRPKALLAAKGEGEFCAGEWCRFCKARYTCRKRSEYHMRLAERDFKQPDLMTDEEILDILPVAESLNNWVQDLISYATQQAVGGKAWPGYKLVAGRSVRRYTSEAEVIKAATEAGYTDIYKTTLLGVGDLEKRMGRKKFSEVLGKYVIKPVGAPQLVPESDSRKPYSDAASDFNDTSSNQY